MKSEHFESFLKRHEKKCRRYVLCIPISERDNDDIVQKKKKN